MRNTRVPLVIDNCHVCEENIHLFGPEALDNLYRQGAPGALLEKYAANLLNPDGTRKKMAWLMFCAPKIAQGIYGYEYGAYREMVSAWARHYGICYAMELMKA